MENSKRYLIETLEMSDADTSLFLSGIEMPNCKKEIPCLGRGINVLSLKLFRRAAHAKS